MGQAGMKPRLLPPPASAGTAEAPCAPVEREVVTDMVRRSWPILPVLVVVAGVFWGAGGALSAAYAIGLVLLNYFVSASLLAWSARIALPLMMVAALGGFIVRLALITVAVLAVRNQSWVSMVPLGFTLIITHLGLLIWEARHLTMSLAYPTTAPRKP